MYRSVATSAFIFILMFPTRAAYAFVDPPVLVPPNPVSGQTVSISIFEGVCDALIAFPAPTITQNGNNIHMVVQSANSPDPEFCIYPTGTAYIVVGAFAAGNYSLQVDRVYPGLDGSVTETLGILPFAVSGVASIPTLGPIGLVALVLLLLAAVRGEFHRRICR
jgi:hypothetical protein